MPESGSQRLPVENMAPGKENIPSICPVPLRSCSNAWVMSSTMLMCLKERGSFASVAITCALRTAFLIFHPLLVSQSREECSGGTYLATVEVPTANAVHLLGGNDLARDLPLSLIGREFFQCDLVQEGRPDCSLCFLVEIIVPESDMNTGLERLRIQYKSK